MFFKSAVVVLAALASAAFGLQINSPKSTDTLTPGQQFVLELDYRVRLLFLYIAFIKCT